MKRLLLALLLLVSASRAVDTLSIPTDYLTVTTGTRATLAGNFTSVQTWGNKVRDSIAQVTARLGGYTGNLAITSLSNLRLKLDGDNSETARLLVESGNGDSLFTVREDSTAKFYGSVTLNSLSASLPVVTNGSKVLTSATVTGTGTTVVMSAAPTGTGLWTLSGGLTVADSIRLTGRMNIVNAQAETFLTSSTANNPATLKLTANGAVGYVAKEGAIGTDFMTGGTAGALQLVTATNVPVQIGVNGAKVATFASTGLAVVDSISTGSNENFAYDEGTFTISLLGCTTTPTATARYVRIGKFVHIYIPAPGTCTSNATALQLDGLPASLYTARNQGHEILGGVTDNGTAYEGSVTLVSGSSNITVSRKTALATYTDTFTGSGTKGLAFDFSLDYTLQ